MSDMLAVERSVLENISVGDIVLLHDMSAGSVQAALDIADALRTQGFTLVTISKLATLRNAHLKPGKIYRKFPQDNHPPTGSTEQKREKREQKQ